jgi:hypothetical protein
MLICMLLTPGFITRIEVEMYLLYSVLEIYTWGFFLRSSGRRISGCHSRFLLPSAVRINSHCIQIAGPWMGDGRRIWSIVFHLDSYPDDDYSQIERRRTTIVDKDVYMDCSDSSLTKGACQWKI